MAGQPNKGAWHGKKPEKSIPFKKGDKRTVEAAKKGGAARKAQCARFRSLREAAEALRDLPSLNPESSNGVEAVLAMYRQAQEGNPKAFHELSLLLGEATQKVEVKDLPTLIDDIPRAETPDT
jgi:hypothetical protein